MSEASKPHFNSDAEIVRGHFRNPGMFPDGAEAFERLVEQLEATQRENAVLKGEAMKRARAEEQLEALDQRHEELLNLARRVSNSFIATQDRFGKDRRKLLWELRDAVESSPASRSAD